MEFWLPYGTTEVPVRVPDQNFQRIIQPPEKKGSQELRSIVEGALDAPIGNVSLQGLVKPGSTIGAVVDPLIPEPFLESTLDILRARLAALGASEVKLFARARSTVRTESVRMVNPAEGQFVGVGTTSRGTKVMVDEGFLGCDLKLLVGIVQPHFASGFVGGPDLVLPGVSSIETIASNRSLAVTTNRSSQGSPSLEGNSVYADALEASGMVGNIYLVSLVPDEYGGISGAHSGELGPTFKESVSHFQRLHSPRVDVRPDIIVVSSDGPNSADLYHAVRILPFLSNITKREGSTIVLAAECRNGVGDPTFMQLSKTFEDRRSMQSDLKRKFRMGGHVALVLKEALEKERVQLVSVLPDAYARSFALKPSRTMSAGVQSAIRVEGKDARILIVPQGSLTVPILDLSPPPPKSDHA